MKEPLISVIVPIYKVEKYLRQCVDSLIRQTYQNLEIILVDDGSPDGCPAICDEYAAQDDRIKVIHKKNGGLSDARNTALDVMQGEYVTFVDGDDYVSSDYAETLYCLLRKNDADISCVQFTKSIGKQKAITFFSSASDEILNSHDALQKLMYFDGLETSANCKLYRANLFCGVKYPVGKLFEDLGTTYKLFLKANKIVNSKAKKYYYRHRCNSIENCNFSLKKMDILEMCNNLRTDVLSVYPDLVKSWNCRYFCANFHILLQIPQNEFKVQEKILINNIKSCRRNILFDRHSRDKARVAALVSYLGMSFTRWIWSRIILR